MALLKLHRTIALAALAIVATGIASSCATTQPPVTPFVPADPALLRDMLLRRDIEGMRRHAWSIWARITSDAGNNQPVWRTWWSASATLQSKTPETFFEPVTQLASERSAVLGVRPDALEPPVVMQHVFFNAAAHDFVLANKLNVNQTLTDANLQMDRAQTPTEKRKIPEFPRDAAAIKTIWVIVKSDRMHELPVWIPPAGAPPVRNPPASWPGRVWLAPTAAILSQYTSSGGKDGVLLEQLYSIKLDTPALVESANRSISGGQAQLGDFAALVGMHVATKELENWVWATFWWHPQPNVGPFALGRPPGLGQPWKNYLMDETFDADIPSESGTSDFTVRTPNICFNPWLEGQMHNGAVSNCVACHQRAAWSNTLPGPALGEVTRGRRPDDDPSFASVIRLDYMWSLSRRQMP